MPLATSSRQAAANHKHTSRTHVDRARPLAQVRFLLRATVRDRTHPYLPASRVAFVRRRRRCVVDSISFVFERARVESDILFDIQSLSELLVCAKRRLRHQQRICQTRTRDRWRIEYSRTNTLHTGMDDPLASTLLSIERKQTLVYDYVTMCVYDFIKL